MAAPKANSAVVEIDDVQKYKSLVSKSDYAVLFFWADWHEPCKQIRPVLDELSNDHKIVQFYSINAEACESLTTQFNVSAVPTIVLLKQQKETRRLEAETVPNTVAAITQFAQHSQTALSLKPETPANDEQASPQKESVDDLNKRIAKLISAAPIMLFMKGTPDEPKCKFSRETIEVLKKEHVTRFGYFNILNDPAVRSQIKVYSNWKTFPQLYIDGKLIGGLDIIKEKIEDGEFQALLPSQIKNEKELLQQRLKQLVNQQKIMLFIKGTPSAPQCGFSNQMVGLLKQRGITDFGYFDILEDMEVRQGLKEFSKWPTFPQLYVNGTLIGGLDVVREMIEDDEFDDAIKG
mmetsp:Transcript_41542/g.68365  ORF Transcript_41542/g.68365 Transcript_41542/m.68365 type:complete len:349 (-) Transcript_41542:11-1057(-)